MIIGCFAKKAFECAASELKFISMKDLIESACQWDELNDHLFPNYGLLVLHLDMSGRYISLFNVHAIEKFRKLVIVDSDFSE